MVNTKPENRRVDTYESVNRKDVDALLRTLLNSPIMRAGLYSDYASLLVRMTNASMAVTGTVAATQSGTWTPNLGTSSENREEMIERSHMAYDISQRNRFTIS